MANLSPAPKLQFFDGNGNPLVGGKLYSYAAGTTTPLATFTDSTEGSTNPNPTILDSRGEANVWLGTAQYKLKLTTSTDVDIWTVDNIGSGVTLSQLAAPGGAALIGNTPAGTIAATTVQGAINEIVSDLAASSGSSLVGFLQAGTGATARTTQSKLRDVVSVKDFGAVGNGVADDTAAIQAAIDTGFTATCPPGTYKTTQPLIIGGNEHLHLMSGATIYGMSATNQPVIRLVADYAKLTGDGKAIVRTDNLTGNLNDPTKEGIVNGGPLTMTSPKVDLNWWEISGITFIGNVSVWNQFEAGTSLAIDDYICVNLVNGQALPGIGAGSVYNGWIKDCVFSFAGIGVNCEPVVQGNNFYNLYFYNISKGGVRYVGSGENSLNQTFFHGGACEAFVWMESTPLKLKNVSGTFVANDVVTGGSSGATLTLYPNIPYDSTDKLIYGVRSGAFVSGESVTGSISGATAVVDDTRFQYAMTAEGVGRPCYANSVTNLMGEPDGEAPLALGGRFSRFVYIYDGNDFHYVQGRGNTGHGYIDYGSVNVVMERAMINQSIVINGRKITFGVNTGVNPSNPVEFQLATTTNDTGWSLTNPWARFSFYTEDTSDGGPRTLAAIDAVAAATSGGFAAMSFKAWNGSTLAETFKVDFSQMLKITTAGKGVQLYGDVTWTSGNGSPEGVVTAPPGSLYSRLDGGAGTTLYVKEGGTGASGWTAK